MAKKKSPTLPATPTYTEDPLYGQGIQQLFGLGGRMTALEGLPGPLMEALSTSPETTQMFLTGLKSQLDPIFRDIRQETINQLAANRQLESSVTANRLATLESDLQQKYIGQTTAFGLADIERAMRNRMGLFGAGVDVLGGATGMSGERGWKRSQFDLANYENLVAKTLAEQKQKRGGLFGGLTGGIGGALAGLALAPLTGGSSLMLAGLGGLGGGLMGGLGPSGTGMGILQGGAGMIGTYPGMTAGAGTTFRGGLSEPLDLNWLAEWDKMKGIGLS